jgi:flagellar hook-associated protein 3 FlgL
MTLVDRLTSSAQSARTIDSLTAAQNRMARVQNQVSSGKAFERVSEDPNAARTAMSLRSEQMRAAQYSKNIDNGLLMLNASRIHVDSVNGQLLRARDLLVQGQSATATANVRSALAAQIDVLKSSLLIDANAQFGGRALFGGATSATTAYSAAGAYTGDTNQITTRVDENSTMRIEIQGPELFGTGASNAFAVLTGIAANLRSSPVGDLAGDLTKLDALLKTAGDAQAVVGSRINQLTELRDVMKDRDVNLTGALSRVEDTDLSKAIMELTLQQTGYEAALRATASVMQVSLMDFLR